MGSCMLLSSFSKIFEFSRLTQCTISKFKFGSIVPFKSYFDLFFMDVIHFRARAVVCHTLRHYSVMHRQCIADEKKKVSKIISMNLVFRSGAITTKRWKKKTTNIMAACRHSSSSADRYLKLPISISCWKVVNKPIASICMYNVNVCADCGCTYAND